MLAKIVMPVCVCQCLYACCRYNWLLLSRSFTHLYFSSGYFTHWVSTCVLVSNLFTLRLEVRDGQREPASPAFFGARARFVQSEGRARRRGILTSG